MYLVWVGDLSVFSGCFMVLVVSYELKVVLNDLWDESYGLDGGLVNILFVFVGGLMLEFIYDYSTYCVGIVFIDLFGLVIDVDKELVSMSLCALFICEWFYFLMVDWFVNGDIVNDIGGLIGGCFEIGFDFIDKGFYYGGDFKGVI